LRAPNRQGVTYYSNIQEVRAFEQFAGAFFAATSAGLISFDDRGQMTAHYTTLDGLPDNDLTALAVFQGQLFIGAASQGLVAYDGRQFNQYRFLQPKADHVTALATSDDTLFIGTWERGLFEYDGTQFRRTTIGGGSELAQVTAVLPHYPEIYVGTYNQGLFAWREGRWDHLTTKEGLPSDRVTAVLEDSDGVLIGTDLGIARWGGGSGIVPVAQLGNVISLVRFQEKVYAGLFIGRILQLDGSKQHYFSKAQQSQLTLSNNTTILALSSADNRLWALTSRGLYFSPSPGTEPFRRFDQPSEALHLSASHISALATDWQGRLWLGYFDRGIDIIDSDQAKLITHIEDTVVREINALRASADGQRMIVATSEGLVIIDSSLRHQRYTERDGLISNTVSSMLDVPASIALPGSEERSHQGEALMLTTARGLSIYAQDMFRSLTAFHGLASNHLYTGAQLGDRLFVGSLNGLNELEGLRVVRTFQTSNSRLSHNWVSALAAVGSTLYIGTYGGGVDALLPSGEMINFAPLIGRFSVNPNAMHFDGERLYVGTLDQGVWVLDIERDTWSHFTQGLGSNNVTAIAGDAHAIYFGTDRGLSRIERARFKEIESLARKVS
jgi:ligand-binding sensor domain-containing protein